jgi:hypothetical protein
MPLLFGTSRQFLYVRDFGRQPGLSDMANL